MEDKKNTAKRISAWTEWCIYTSQYFRILLGSKKNLLVSLLFPVLASVIVVWIAGENMFVHYDGTKSGSFVIVSAAIWGGLFNSITTIVKERANVKRDFVTGARVECYLLSRAFLQLVLCAVQSMILMTCYFGIKACYDNSLPEKGIIFFTPIIEFYVSVLLLTYAADAMGLMISCIVHKEETANVLAPYILIVQLIFSGILFAMDGVADYVSYFMISRWGMEALGCISRLNDLQLRIQMTIPTVPHDFEERFDATAAHLTHVWGILVGFILFFIAVGMLLLHRVSKDHN